MQKKKPSFQVIPNYRVSGFTNWNESKEVPAEQGRNDAGVPTSPTAAGLFCTVNRHRQTIAAISRPEAEFQIPEPKMVQRNSVILGAILARIRQPYSLNIQAKYETLCAGRPDSLS
jgi:hypothetical protein